MIDTQLAKQYAKKELPIIIEKSNDERIKIACQNFLIYLNSMGTVYVRFIDKYDRVDALTQIKKLLELGKLAESDEKVLEEFALVEEAVNNEIQNVLGGRKK